VGAGITGEAQRTARSIPLDTERRAELQAKAAERQAQREERREAMLEHLRQLARELGRTPDIKDLNGGPFWFPEYYRKFGTLGAAQRLAGLEQTTAIRGGA
jgi:hypothetical protein